jgi:phospho-N-acetylmuramoyl-pentapeptide-transferase
MFFEFSARLSAIWGPFRLLGSFLVLMGLGAVMAAVTVGILLPRYWDRLPRDRGRSHTPNPDKSMGKPTGAGIIMATVLVPLLLLLVPLTPKLCGVIGCLFLAMLTGYLDDRSPSGWGEKLKGGLDLAVALLTSYFLCEGNPMTIWLPLHKGEIVISAWIFIPVATFVLWMAINTTNCSDGVDGLAGSLTLLSLFHLGAFLYVVIGHRMMAEYLLVPHNPEGARWAVLIFTAIGGLAAYLWYNAEPSRILMGDAGSRFLGLLLGVAVLATGNPLIILVVAPVALVNGGTGLFKLLLLRLFKRFGVDIQNPYQTKPATGETSVAPGGGGPCRFIVNQLHRVRFPLHDHCRKNLHWSNAQVLLRFMLLQSILTPLLLGLLVKVR